MNASAPRHLVSASRWLRYLPQCSAGNRLNGFTVLELMVVLAIAAILVALAVPSLTQVVRINTMASTVNTFLADMRYARSESIRRGGGVVMCRSGNPEAVNAACNSDATIGWETGWIIFHDLDNDGARVPAEQVLRAHAPTATVNTILAVGKASVFGFTATGRLSLPATLQLQFGSSPVYAADVQRTVCINPGGYARVAIDNDGRPTGSASCSTGP